MCIRDSYSYKPSLRSLECLASTFKCSGMLNRIYLYRSGTCKRFWQATLLFNDDPEGLSLLHCRTPCKSLKRSATENAEFLSNHFIYARRASAFKIPRHGKPLGYQKCRSQTSNSTTVNLTVTPSRAFVVEAWRICGFASTVKYGGHIRGDTSLATTLSPGCRYFFDFDNNREFSAFAVSSLS